MNNCDSVQEGAVTPLVLCPACMRMLQLRGGFRDGRRVLAGLRRVLRQSRFREHYSEELIWLERALREEGGGAGRGGDERADPGGSEAELIRLYLQGKQAAGS